MFHMRKTLFPPLTPPRPSLAPPGERGEPLTAHVAACSKWMSSSPQATGCNAHCAFGQGGYTNFKFTYFKCVNRNHEPSQRHVARVRPDLKHAARWAVQSSPFRPGGGGKGLGDRGGNKVLRIWDVRRQLPGKINLLSIQ